MSKTEKMRGRLASIQKDREEFERQRKELEADMNVGRTNMSKINKGLRNNAISEEPIVVDTHIGAGAHGTPHYGHSSKPVSERTPHLSTREHGGGFGANAGSTPTTVPSASFSMNGNGTPTHATMMLAGAGNAGTASPGSMLNIMPSGPRVSDWCYSAQLESAPPTVKSREMYENVRLLGRGSFGEVNLVKNIEDNKLFAIKTQLCPKESEFHNVLREVRFLRACRHPCIIDVHDAFSMTNPRIVYIVMHYCEAGTIASVISSAKKNKSTLAENQVIKWVLQLALAMQFLHDNHVIHRDLKPMNVMLTEGGDSLKLADFGLAMSMSELSQEDATDEAGTPYYTAPEMITREPYSYPADCWSFGVIVHQLLALERPFDGSSTGDLVKAILSQEAPPLPPHYSEDIKLISAELLRKDQNERLTMTDLLLEPVFHGKLTSFPQNYRPRTLEERIRRSHQKQLEVQIDTLNRQRKAEGWRNLHERVAARQAAAQEAAMAAEAAAAALAATGAEAGGSASAATTDAAGASRNSPAVGTRERSSSQSRSGSVSGAGASVRSSAASTRNLAASTSGARLSNADAAAAQASAAAAGVQRTPSSTLLTPLEVANAPPSVSCMSTPDRPDRSPTDVAERTQRSSTQKTLEVTNMSIPEETAQDMAQSLKFSAAAAMEIVEISETTAAPDAVASADAVSEPAVENTSTVAIRSSESPPPSAQPTQKSESILHTQSSIETISNSPIKPGLSERQFSNGRMNSSGDMGSPQGGRKGLELARAKETDLFYEAQLSGDAQEGVAATVPITPGSHSQSFAMEAGGENPAGEAQEVLAEVVQQATVVVEGGSVEAES